MDTNFFQTMLLVFLFGFSAVWFFLAVYLETRNVCHNFHLLNQDERLLIVHFMGGSKHIAPEVLCGSSGNFTGEAPEGYGCRK